MGSGLRMSVEEQSPLSPPLLLSWLSFLVDCEWRCALGHTEYFSSSLGERSALPSSWDMEKRAYWGRDDSHAQGSLLPCPLRDKDMRI